MDSKVETVIAGNSDAGITQHVDGSLRIYAKGVMTSLIDGTARVSNMRIIGGQGANAASATSLDLGAYGNAFYVTGTTNINFIVQGNWADGSRVILIFQGALTVAHNKDNPPAGSLPFMLTGAADYTTVANATLSLIMCNSCWYEVSRSTP